MKSLIFWLLCFSALADVPYISPEEAKQKGFQEYRSEEIRLEASSNPLLIEKHIG